MFRRIQQFILYRHLEVMIGEELKQTGDTYVQNAHFDRDGMEKRRFSELVSFYEIQATLNAEPRQTNFDANEVIRRQMMRLVFVMEQVDILEGVHGKMVEVRGTFIRANYSELLASKRKQRADLARRVEPFIHAKASELL